MLIVDKIVFGQSSTPNVHFFNQCFFTSSLTSSLTSSSSINAKCLPITSFVRHTVLVQCCVPLNGTPASTATTQWRVRIEHDFQEKHTFIILPSYIFAIRWKPQPYTRTPKFTLLLCQCINEANISCICYGS